jgi:hypothetical protein
VTTTTGKGDPKQFHAKVDVDLSGLAPVAARFRGAFASLRARVRNSLLLEGAAIFGLGFVVYFSITWPVDRLFRLEMPVRLALLIAFIVWMIVLVVRRVYRPMSLVLDDEEMALAIERSNAGLSQHLISSVQFWRQLQSGDSVGADSRQLMSRVVGELPQALGKVEIADAMKAEHVRRNRLFLFGAIVFVVLVATFYSGFGLWARRNLLLSPEDWRRQTELTVVDAKNGRLVVPRGDDFTVAVDAAGVIPETLRIRYEFDDGNRADETMTQNVGEQRFTFTFPGLVDPVRFQAWGGDGETRWIRVDLVDRPSLSSQQVTIVYPAYMKRDPKVVADDVGEVVVPRGARLDLVATANKKLKRASLAVGELVVPAEVGTAGRKVSGGIEPDASGPLVVQMLDVDNLTHGEGRRLFVRVVPDKGPRLTAKVRGLGAWITFKARIPVELGISDDFGLQRLEVYRGVGRSAAIGSSEKPEEVFKTTTAEGLGEFEPGVLRFERLVRHDLLPFAVNPDDAADEKNPIRAGMFVAVRFRAWDNNPKAGDGGQASTSDAFTFKVVTVSELLRELTRRQGELRVEFEKVIANEKADRAELRELQDPAAPGGIGARIVNRISTMARRQRSLAKRVLGVGRRYGQILDEMINNRVGSAIGGGEATVRRRRSLIIDRLEDLGKSVMPKLARIVAEYGRSKDGDLRTLAASGYDDVISRMERVLREMKKLKSFAEILTKLREVISLTDEAREAARKRLKAEMEELFGSGQKKK